MAFLELCSHAAFSDSSTAPCNYEALQYIPQSHSPHMPSHVVNNIHHILDSPNTYDNMISSLQQQDSSCMFLSDLATVPASSALSDPLDIMNVCDIWSLFGDPPLQLDATHKPDYASHTPNEIHFQEDLQLLPPPMDTIQANPTHSATVTNGTHSSPACLKHSTSKHFAKKPSEIISQPLPLSSSSSELQRRNHLTRIRSTGSLKENAEKVDNITPRMLKNRSYERRRRKKLNDKLYSLRLLVPKISKMDKASIVSDAIEHVQDLQKQVALRQQEISSLQSRLDAGAHGTLSTGAGAALSTRRQHPRVFSTCIQPGHLVPARKYHQHKVLKMDVVKMENDIYQLIIECAKGKCTLVHLIRALEALHFDILSSNLTSIGGIFINTLVLQAKILKSMELREIILEILPKFGLILCEKEGRKNA